MDYMENWRESNEFRLIQPVIRPGDEIDMPWIATGAFKIKRAGRTMKLKRMSGQWELESVEIHKFLKENGWVEEGLIPDILAEEQIGNDLFVYFEWLEGETGREYGVEKLPEDYYYDLGELAGKLHNTIYKGQSIATLNWWPRNVLMRPNNTLTWIDCSKFYKTNFPECFNIKCIVAETSSVSKPKADAFLEGYRRFRKWDDKEILRKYLELFRQYHDIYVDGELFKAGPRPVKKRLEMMELPSDMSGMYVLDLGYGDGMFSLECALRGAKRVSAIDNRYVNIGPAHHSFSDIGNLMAVHHGFTEETLLYKHMDINTNWFIEEYIPDSLRYIPKKKYDIIFALAIVDHLNNERKPAFFKMLSDSTDCLYFESRMGGRSELEGPRLKQYTTFPNVEYLGNPSCNQNKFRYALYRCTR